MAINALAISGPDPGAIPGGSTNLFPCHRRASMGPTSIDGRVKRLLSPVLAHRIGPLNYLRTITSLEKSLSPRNAVRVISNS